MSHVIRSQNLCYYSSPSHVNSWYGKYWYIYEGKTGLVLTQTDLIFENGPFFSAVPLFSIQSLTIGRFSRWSKVIALHYIHLQYQRTEVEKEIFLVPTTSPFLPVWETNAIVSDWCDILQEAVASANNQNI